MSDTMLKFQSKLYEMKCNVKRQKLCWSLSLNFQSEMSGQISDAILDFKS